MGDTGLEPVTPSLSSNGTPNVSVDTKALAETLATACTTACTRMRDEVQTDSLKVLAAELIGVLPEDEVARFVEMLTDSG